MSWTREDASHLVARTCFDGSVALVEELFVWEDAAPCGRCSTLQIT